ncbi:MAG: hypothetical protein ACR2ML_12690 [Solirubrobacteraceae bacterium]
MPHRARSEFKKGIVIVISQLIGQPGAWGREWDLYDEPLGQTPLFELLDTGPTFYGPALP